ncbi:MAG: hypothetical protein JSS94_04960 [Bacteroidetes bacterium]|nr:hypothetical protein [Bacteroidota bacterium]
MKNTEKILISLFILISLKYTAQFNELLHKKYNEKIIPINEFYLTSMKLSPPQAVQKAQELKEFGKKNKDISLELEADLYLAYYNISNKIGNEKKYLTDIIKVEKKGKKAGIFDIEARAVKVQQNYYWYDKKNYEIAFDYALKLDQLLRTTNAKDFPDLPEYYYIIGGCYYLFRDYPTAIKYFKETLKSPETEFNWRARWSAGNTMGLCYMKLNKIDSSNVIFKKTASSKFLNKDSIQYTISMGNIAYNLYRKGNFEKAKPLFKEDYNNALKNKDYGLAAGAMIPIADIYISEGKISEAWELLQRASSYIRNTNQTERYEKLYPIISRWYDRQGNIKKSIEYKDSAAVAAQENNNTFSSLMILRVQQKIAKQKLENAEWKLRESNRNHLIKMLSFVAFVIVLLIFVLLYYRYMNRIYTERKRAKDAELKFSEAQLENAKQKIDSFLKEIESKNTLISHLQHIDHSVQNIAIIEEIKKTAILTDEDWGKFRLAFEQIHPGYIDRLKDKFPHVTPAEIRIMVLSRIELSHKEIANILGISAQSSRVTWHRLRKKLNIEEGVSPQDFSIGI